MPIRPATLDDADALTAIHAPLVRDTAISFEIDPPTVDDMRGRIDATLARLPWLVSEDDPGRVDGRAGPDRQVRVVTTRRPSKTTMAGMNDEPVPPPEPTSRPASAPPPARGLVRDPAAIPIVGIDDHLPAVPPARLTPGALRDRFAPTLAGSPDAFGAWRPDLTGDGQRLVRGPLRPAAVLVALVMHDDALRVLFTRRTAHLQHHAGQISFPGGRQDPEDADEVATALREAREEIGLPGHEVEVIGRLPTYTTVTAYEVTPVVALVAPQAELEMHAFEVAEIFEVPLPWLMDPAHHRRHAVHWDGLERQFLSMPWTGPGRDGVSREYFIWGATAAMLRNLYGFLRA